MPESDGDSCRRPRGRAVVLRISHGASSQALVIKSDRASQRHAAQANQRRWDLSEPRFGGPLNLDGSHRTDRRLDNGTPVHERGIYAACNSQCTELYCERVSNAACWLKVHTRMDAPSTVAVSSVNI